jgi:peptidoglycan/LPS O-acetylase OafA/YrhL
MLDSPFLALRSPVVITPQSHLLPKRLKHYRNDIDGLRAVAVLVVVFFHAKLPGFSGGFVGVDVFFVISGYLITGLIAEDYQAGRFTFAAFYFRRIRRIVPALLCVYVGSTLLAAVLMLPSDMAEFARSLTASAAFVSNHFFYGLAGYFGGQSELKPLMHTWSLSIEEQFYLVWPVLFLLLARWRFPRLSSFIWVASAVSVAASAAMVAYHKEAAFFLAPFRAWELLLGAWLALLTPRLAIDARNAELCATAGLTMILASVVLLDEGQSFPGLLALPACVGTALLILVGLGQQRPTVTRLLSTNPAVAIGLVSYPLYLWHWPILAFARYHLDRPLRWSELIMLLALSLLAAAATCRYVEQPARRISFVRVPRVVAAGVLSLAAIALIGRHIDKNYGWTFNLNPEIRRLDMTARSENVYRKACSGPKNIFRNDEACTFGRPRTLGSYNIAIFGDSYADHYTPAMDLLAQEAGLSGRQITVGGCLALLGYYEIISPYATEARCRALREAMLRFVQGNSQLQIAVLAHRWSIYTGTALYREEGHQPFYLLASSRDERSEQRSLQVLRESLEKTVDFFEGRGVHVLLLGEPPPLGRDPIKCVAASIKGGLDVHTCRRPAAEVRHRLDAVNRLFSDVANRHNGVSFYSPLDTMCDEAWCSPIVDGVYMYRDSGHLNRIGAEHLSRTIQAHLPDLFSSSASAFRGAGPSRGPAALEAGALL